LGEYEEIHLSLNVFALFLEGKRQEQRKKHSKKQEIRCSFSKRSLSYQVFLETWELLEELEISAADFS